MSFLDDLKKQAQEKSTSKAQEDSSTLRYHDQNWHILAPKFHYILSYFKDLAENLNIVKSEGLSSYSLTKTTVLEDLKKQNFRIVKSNKELMRSFSFCYDLVAVRDMPIIINNLPEAEKVRNIFKKQNIHFVENVENKNRITMMVRNPKIFVRFHYSVDAEKCVILLRIDNFEGSWNETCQYSPDKITESLLEETAKYILNQPNKFKELSGYSLSNEMRKDLQQRMKLDDRNSRGNKKDLLGRTASKVIGMFKK